MHTHALLGMAGYKDTLSQAHRGPVAYLRPSDQCLAQVLSLSNPKEEEHLKEL